MSTGKPYSVMSRTWKSRWEIWKCNHFHKKHHYTKIWHCNSEVRSCHKCDLKVITKGNAYAACAAANFQYQMDWAGHVALYHPNIDKNKLPKWLQSWITWRKDE